MGIWREPPERFSAIALRDAITSQNILHVPYKPTPTPGSRGRPPSRLTHKAWISLTVDGSEPSALPVNPNTSQGRIAIAANSAQLSQENDPSGPWSALSFPLRDMHKILHKRVLPTEWYTPTLAPPANEDAQVINSTYDWVIKNINISNESHHLILIIAIVVTRCIPLISLPQNLSLLFNS